MSGERMARPPLEAVQRCRRMVATMRCVVVVSEFFHLLPRDLAEHCPRFDSTHVVRLSPRALSIRCAYLKVHGSCCPGTMKFERAATSIQRVFRGHHGRGALCRRPKEQKLGQLQLMSFYGKTERWVYCPPPRRETPVEALSRRRVAYHTQWRELCSLRDKQQAVLATHLALQGLLDRCNGKDIATSLIDGFPSTYAPPIIQSFLSRRLPTCQSDVQATTIALQYEATVQPLLHHAVTLISARLRMRPVRVAFLKRRAVYRAAEIRRAKSEAACLKRLTGCMQRRHHAMAVAAATTVASWWRMLRAIPVRLALRRAHALRQLSLAVWIVWRAKPLAKVARYCVQQRRVERHVRQLVWRRMLGEIFAGWCAFVASAQDKRRRRRALYEAGMRQGIHRAAICLQRTTRRYLFILRPRYTVEVLPQLHPLLAHHVARWTQIAFVSAVAVLDAVRVDLAARCEPIDPLWRQLAAKYKLPVSEFDPLETWLPTVARESFGANWVTRMETRPWRMAFLAFLESCGFWYERAAARPAQLAAIEGRLEADCVMTSYAAHLAATHRRPFFETDPRPLVADWHRLLQLRRRMVASAATTADDTQAALARFHHEAGPEKTLCEHCFAMLRIDAPSACRVCGFSFLERPTAASVASADAEEPVDLVVLHAFFHAMAPVGHANRLREVPALWKRATAHALPWIQVLYDAGLRSLVDVLVLPPCLLTNAIGLPTAVHAKLLLFLRVLQDLAKRNNA
ncbi:hypothetical protein ACHHYP_09254 [Achlya hypogyna]|uniref:Uncharacterized protein n=1 Tax=Achlya hypogyna TaxID=1202772 RepID=A0A1V9ZJ49_ACHHY|nr:hypothetical protein ACHHYP_09254 [Achlya hypogyna]